MPVHYLTVDGKPRSGPFIFTFLAQALKDVEDAVELLLIKPLTLFTKMDNFSIYHQNVKRTSLFDFGVLVSRLLRKGTGSYPPHHARLFFASEPSGLSKQFGEDQPRLMLNTQARHNCR
jgi:hypothetical protein